MDLEELVGWLAFWHLEPFGDSWRRSARMAVAVAGSLGKVDDNAESMLMPNYSLEDDCQSEAEMAAVLAGVPLFREQMRAQGVL